MAVFQLSRFELRLFGSRRTIWHACKMAHTPRTCEQEPLAEVRRQGQFMKGRGRPRPRLLAGRRLVNRGRGRPRPCLLRFMNWPWFDAARSIPLFVRSRSTPVMFKHAGQQDHLGMRRCHFGQDEADARAVGDQLFSKRTQVLRLVPLELLQVRASESRMRWPKPSASDRDSRPSSRIHTCCLACCNST